MLTARLQTSPGQDFGGPRRSEASMDGWPLRSQPAQLATRQLSGAKNNVTLAPGAGAAPLSPPCAGRGQTASTPAREGLPLSVGPSATPSLQVPACTPSSPSVASRQISSIASGHAIDDVSSPTTSVGTRGPRSASSVRTVLCVRDAGRLHPDTVIPRRQSDHSDIAFVHRSRNASFPELLAQYSGASADGVAAPSVGAFTHDTDRTFTSSGYPGDDESQTSSRFDAPGPLAQTVLPPGALACSSHFVTSAYTSSEAGSSAHRFGGGAAGPRGDRGHRDLVEEEEEEEEEEEMEQEREEGRQDGEHEEEEEAERAWRDISLRQAAGMDELERRGEGELGRITSGRRAAHGAPEAAAEAWPRVESLGQGAAPLGRAACGPSPPASPPHAGTGAAAPGSGGTKRGAFSPSRGPRKSSAVRAAVAWRAGGGALPPSPRGHWCQGADAELSPTLPPARCPNPLGRAIVVGDDDMEPLNLEHEEDAEDALLPPAAVAAGSEALDGARASPPAASDQAGGRQLACLVEVGPYEEEEEDEDRANRRLSPASPRPPHPRLHVHEPAFPVGCGARVDFARSNCPSLEDEARCGGEASRFEGAGLSRFASAASVSPSNAGRMLEEEEAEAGGAEEEGGGGVMVGRWSDVQAGWTARGADAPSRARDVQWRELPASFHAASAAALELSTPGALPRLARTGPGAGADASSRAACSALASLAAAEGVFPRRALSIDAAREDATDPSPAAVPPASRCLQPRAAAASVAAAAAAHSSSSGEWGRMAAQRFVCDGRPLAPLCVPPFSPGEGAAAAHAAHGGFASRAHARRFVGRALRGRARTASRARSQEGIVPLQRSPTARDAMSRGSLKRDRSISQAELDLDLACGGDPDCDAAAAALQSSALEMQGRGAHHAASAAGSDGSSAGSDGGGGAGPRPAAHGHVPSRRTRMRSASGAAAPSPVMRPRPRRLVTLPGHAAALAVHSRIARSAAGGDRGLATPRSGFAPAPAQHPRSASAYAAPPREDNSPRGRFHAGPDAPRWNGIAVVQPSPHYAEDDSAVDAVPLGDDHLRR